jgi:hypothetical protein
VDEFFKKHMNFPQAPSAIKANQIKRVFCVLTALPNFHMAIIETEREKAGKDLIPIVVRGEGSKVLIRKFEDGEEKFGLRRIDSPIFGESLELPWESELTDGTKVETFQEMGENPGIKFLDVDEKMQSPTISEVEYYSVSEIRRRFFDNGVPIDPSFAQAFLFLLMKEHGEFFLGDEQVTIHP